MADRMCHIIIHTMSHHHTYYVTSSYILCHIIIHTISSNLRSIANGSCPFAHSKTAYQAQKFSKVCNRDVVGDMCPPFPFLFCAPARDMCPLSMGENGFLRNWVFVDLFMLGSFSLTYFCWECLAVMRQTLLRPRYCVCVWVIYMYVLCVCVFLCVYVCVCVCVCLYVSRAWIWM